MGRRQTMPTDTERREVARRLRETGEELGSAALLWYHIAKILGVRTATDGKTACDRLADLIEPSCDRDALLALADEMDERAPYGWYSGERDSLREYARRIRKALGVSDD